MKLLPIILIALSAGLVPVGASAEDDEDIFQGQLFSIELILEHRTELDLTKAQSDGIRKAVVELQTKVPALEWDMQEAYLEVLDELGKHPIDAEAVMGPVRTALKAENEVKIEQVQMLIRVRNLLTEDQAAFLRRKMGYDD